MASSVNWPENGLRLRNWIRVPSPPPLPQKPQPQLAITDADTVEKCSNFLKTLIKLSKQQAGEVTNLVQRCVESILLGSMSPREFTTEIQKAVQSSAQAHLIPFLERALPPLRKAIQEGRVVIEGVDLKSAFPKNLRPEGGPHLPTVTCLSQDLKHPPVRPAGFPASPVSISSPAAVKTLLLKSSPIFQPQQVQMQQKHPRQFPATPENAKHKQEPTVEELNDVAAMGGVNLAEETEYILATSSAHLQTHTRSALEEEEPQLVNLGSLRRRILERGAAFGVGDAHGDAVTLVSLALQRRLRDWLQRLATIAEHRMQPIRSNPFYGQISDVKGQLRFLDEVDRLEYQRKEDRKMEMLIKLSKNKSGRIEDEDAERLKAKAKELQKAEQQEVLNRDANMAAQLALQRNTRKRPHPEEVLAGETDSFAQPLVPPVGPYHPSLGTQTSRMRIKRVSIKDLHLVLSEDKHSLTEYRSLLTSPSQSS